MDGSDLGPEPPLEDIIEKNARWLNAHNTPARLVTEVATPPGAEHGPLYRLLLSLAERRGLHVLAVRVLKARAGGHDTVTCAVLSTKPLLSPAELARVFEATGYAYRPDAPR